MKTRFMTIGKAVLGTALIALIAAPSDAAWRQKKSKKQQRKEIIAIAKETRQKLFDENPEAKELYDTAFGWAVFDVRQTKLLLSGGGGVGVAIEKKSKQKTFMKTASLGVGVGLGVQLYQAVFLFETEEVMTNFVENGWEVGAGANAVAGDEGENLQVTATDTDEISAGANEKAGFASGLAVFQFTEKGYMLQADISGTKYWKDEELN